MRMFFYGLGGSFLLALGALWLVIGHYELRGLAPLGRGKGTSYLAGLACAGLGAFALFTVGPLAALWLLVGLPLAASLILCLSVLAYRSPNLDPLVPFRDGLPGHWRSEQVSFPLGKEGVLGKGLLMVPKESRGAGVVVAHGLGNDGECFKWKLYGALLGRGLAVLALDLAGHGRRRDTPLRYPEVLSEIPASVSYLASRPEVRGGEIGALGVSLGGALALRAAGDDERIKAVVTLAAPHHLEVGRAGIIREVLTLLSPPILRLFREASLYHLLKVWVGKRPNLGMAAEELVAKLEVLEAARRIAPRPLLLIHGAEDHAIPPEQAEAIFRMTGEPKRLVKLVGQSHLTMLFSSQAVEATAQWFECYLTDSN